MKMRRDALESELKDAMVKLSHTDFLSRTSIYELYFSIPCRWRSRKPCEAAESGESRSHLLKGIARPPSGSVTSLAGHRSGVKDAFRDLAYCGECQP